MPAEWRAFSLRKSLLLTERIGIARQKILADNERENSTSNIAPAIRFRLTIERHEERSCNRIVNNIRVTKWYRKWVLHDGRSINRRGKARPCEDTLSLDPLQRAWKTSLTQTRCPPHRCDTGPSTSCEALVWRATRCYHGPQSKRKLDYQFS